jgi:hypothetical protein
LSIASYSWAAIVSLRELAAIRPRIAAEALLLPALMLPAAAPLACQADALTAGTGGAIPSASVPQRRANSRRLAGVTRRPGEVMGELY